MPMTVKVGTTIQLFSVPIDGSGAATNDYDTLKWKCDNPASELVDHGYGHCSIIAGLGTSNVTASDGTITSSKPFTIIGVADSEPGPAVDITISQV